MVLATSICSAMVLISCGAKYIRRWTTRLYSTLALTLATATATATELVSSHRFSTAASRIEPRTFLPAERIEDADSRKPESHLPA